MGYIIKDTAALVNSKLTDAGRKRISEGTFNISYFQVGDSGTLNDWRGPVETAYMFFNRPSYKVNETHGGSAVTAATSAASWASGSLALTVEEGLVRSTPEGFPSASFFLYPFS